MQLPLPIVAAAALAFPVSALAGIFDSAPKPDSLLNNPPARILYLNAPLPVKPDDPFALFDAIRKVHRKDPFEKTEEYRARLAASDLLTRDFRLVIVPTNTEVHPYPDNDFYVLTTGMMISPDGLGGPPVIQIASIDDSATEAPMQNAYGAIANVRSVSGRVLKVLITNWSQLGKGLIWQGHPGENIELGIPFRKPSAELLQMMKERKLALMLRVRINHLDEVHEDVQGSPATIALPLSTFYETITVPAELEALSVVSADLRTGYALWAKEIPPATKQPGK